MKILSLISLFILLVYGQESENVESPADIFWDMINHLCPRIPRIRNRTDDIIFEKELGHGSFGTVFRAQYKLDDGSVLHSALKSAKLASEKKAFQLAMETCTMFKFQKSPYIAQVLAIGADTSGHTSKVLIAMEEYGQDLSHFFWNYWHSSQNKRAKLQIDVRRIFFQSALALRDVHSEGILHLDIKPENYMWKNDRHQDVVLIDFGMARSINPAAEDHFPERLRKWQEKAPGRVGTLKYMAPELLQSLNTTIQKAYGSAQKLLDTYFHGSEEDKDEIDHFIATHGLEASPTLASDIFSLGVCFYKIAVKEDAFPIPGVWKDQNGQSFDVMRGSKIMYAFALSRNPMPSCEDIDPHLCDLIHRMLHVNPKQRPNIQQVLQDKYFNPRTISVLNLQG